MKRIMMIIMAVALVALPTIAQSFGEQEQPKAQFQSTSVMQTSGSVYASQPAINEDGTAYNPSATPASSGPRKAGSLPPKPTNQEGDTGNTPVGDAVLPLMLMALAFCGVIYLRRRKALNR